jgi:hypothetical protein
MTRKLTDEEKAAIAEVRSLYDSKIAEQEILQAAAMKQLWSVDLADITESIGGFAGRRSGSRQSKTQRLRRSAEAKGKFLPAVGKH